MRDEYVCEERIERNVRIKERKRDRYNENEEKELGETSREGEREMDTPRMRRNQRQYEVIKIINIYI